MEGTNFLEAILGDRLKEALDGGANPGFKPATAVDIAELIEASNQSKFKFGDIVELRTYAKDFFRWPRADDKCIVTQVLEEPHRADYDGSERSGKRLDMAIAFLDPAGRVCEFLHDSRNFRKVATIFDARVSVDKSAH